MDRRVAADDVRVPRGAGARRAAPADRRLSRRAARPDAEEVHAAAHVIPCRSPTGIRTAPSSATGSGRSTCGCRSPTAATTRPASTCSRAASTGSSRRAAAVRSSPGRSGRERSRRRRKAFAVMRPLLRAGRRAPVRRDVPPPDRDGRDDDEGPLRDRDLVLRALRVSGRSDSVRLVGTATADESKQAFSARHPRATSALPGGGRRGRAHHCPLPRRARRVRSQLDTVLQVLRLMLSSDAFLAQVAYRAKARMQALGIPLLPRVAHWIAMMTAQVSIGDPVIVQPGVYIVHGQVVVDGIMEIHSGAVLFPWVTLGLIGPELDRADDRPQGADRQRRAGAGQGARGSGRARRSERGRACRTSRTVRPPSAFPRASSGLTRG